MQNLDIVFRPAKNEDMNAIHAWLVDHDHRQVHGSFLCNWNLTQEVHSEGNIIVGVLQGQPVAYMWRDFGIVEVREDFRRKGIGRTMVGHALSLARQSDVACIDIKCAPETSIPFWRSIGFKTYSDSEAYFLIEKHLSLPEIGDPTEVEIAFYPESRRWDSGTNAIHSFHPSAIKATDGNIYLGQRVAVFAHSPIWDREPIVSIRVNGSEIYLDKAKYQRANEFGIRYADGAYLVDHIVI